MIKQKINIVGVSFGSNSAFLKKYPVLQYIQIEDSSLTTIFSLEKEGRILMRTYQRNETKQKGADQKENQVMEQDNFIMLPTVDFCFKELMHNENVRKGIIAAVLNVYPDEVVDTELLPTILRKESEDEECYRRISFCDTKTGQEYTDLMEMHILELPKLPPERKNETDLMQWMRFLNGKRREDFKKMAEKNSCFEEAYKELDRLSADERKRLEYEARQKAIRDRDILIKTGENRGRKEASQEIIVSMIRAGLPLEQIAEITKKPLEMIQDLKKKSER